MNQMDKLLENWPLKRPYEIVMLPVSGQVNQVPHVWIINGSYVLKKYDQLAEMERSIAINKALAGEGVPVAAPVPIQTREDFLLIPAGAYCLYPRLAGTGLKDPFTGETLKRAHHLGRSVGALHRAFLKLDGMVMCKEQQLLAKLTQWALPILDAFAREKRLPVRGPMQELLQCEFGRLYDKLPRQIIHRDLHCSNMLFDNETLTGYVDFDLSCREIRIFDPCYLATSILSEGFQVFEKREAWIGLFQGIIRGYHEVCPLAREEWQALPYALYAIQLLFIAYFVKHGHEALAATNLQILNWLYDNRSRMEGDGSWLF